MPRTGRLSVFLVATVGLGFAPPHAASPTLDEAPARIEPSTTASSPSSSSLADDEVDGCESALRTATRNEHLDERPSNALFGAVGHAIASDAACKDRVGAWLATAPCNQVHGVVAAAAFASERWEASRTAELLAKRKETACLHTMLPAVQGAAAIDDGLARAVLHTTEGADVVTTDGAWMVVGTVALAARVRGQQDAARALERRIARELSTRMRAGHDATALLEAAGNAGCVVCEADVKRAMASSDVRTRGVAAGGLRFSEARGAAATTCSVLRADAEPSVRAHAAWSLGWARFDLDVRQACLRNAAEGDPSREVRNAAAQALEQLAGETGDTTGE